MQTKLVRGMDPEKDAENIRLAGRVLRRGGLVAMPTETVYGIAANALDTDAVAGIFTAKGRPQDNPLIVHIAELQELAPLVRRVDSRALALAEAFWPGPLTMILEKSPVVPAIVSAGLPTVAMRLPSLPVARAIIREAGMPLAAPSANLSGRPSPTSARHCVEDLWGRVDLIVDGGSCPVGVESTVITLAADVPRLLRPGAVTLEQLRAVLGEVEVDRAVLSRMEDDATVSSPGMKYRHYAPRAQVTLLTGETEPVLAYLAAHMEAGDYALVFEEDMARLAAPAFSLGGREDASAQAERLFALLRELDRQGAERIFARTPSKKGVGLAVYNRLIRAAGFREIEVK